MKFIHGIFLYILLFFRGADNYGQLGQGQGPRYVNKPTKIRTFKNVPIVKIACGQYHMLAVSGMFIEVNNHI